MNRIHTVTRPAAVAAMIGVVLMAGWLSIVSGLHGAAPAAAPAATPPATKAADSDGQAPSPDSALERLLAGNRRYVAAKQQHPHDTIQRREELRDAQHPFAIVVGCADSRVAPELVFDQGLGDIFVVRVAGNVTDPAITGSVSYAVHHLHSPLLIVLGHQGCGALKAALMAPAELAKEPEDIRALVRYVQPSLNDLAPRLTGDDRLRSAVAANVRRTVSQLEQAPSIKQAVAEKHLKIVGGVYSLDTGKVEWLR